MAGILAVVTDLFFSVKVSDGAKHAGRAVTFAQTLDRALELAQTSQPVMLVADLNCKEVDCLELARRFKADAALQSIPLIGFVSHVQEDRKQAALAAGFDRVVARSTFSDQVRQILAANY